MEDNFILSDKQTKTFILIVSFIFFMTISYQIGYSQGQIYDFDPDESLSRLETYINDTSKIPRFDMFYDGEMTINSAIQRYKDYSPPSVYMARLTLTEICTGKK